MDYVTGWSMVFAGALFLVVLALIVMVIEKRLDGQKSQK